jgi:hypothetical protein
MHSGRLYVYNCKRTVEIDDALGSRVLPMMCGIETLEINTIYSEELYSNIHLKLPNYD